MSDVRRFALVVHGGAGVKKDHDYAAQEAHLAAILAEGRAFLGRGGAALDIVAIMVERMEESGLYVAGKGSGRTTEGEVELDASIMDGRTAEAGAVANIRNLRNPIRAARLVMERTPHVMLAGRGAEKFAREQGLEFIEDPQAYYVSAEKTTSRFGIETTDSVHGTVGAVARDTTGNLAAATSTGGIFGKLPSRVGDTPLVGAGTYADRKVAISCTGHGEYFIRAVTAHDIAARMRYGGLDLKTAADQAVNGYLAELGGDGGAISVDDQCHIAMPFNSHGMKRGWTTDKDEPQVLVY